MQSQEQESVLSISPEPPGYSVMQGFVKSNPDNNDVYIQQWEGDPWYPAIRMCHENISRVVPNYNIAQIKDKFGGLRYYYDLPAEEDIDWSLVPTRLAYTDDRLSSLWSWCESEVRVAEAWVWGYEARRREENE